MSYHENVVTVKVTSAIVFEGVIARPGNLIELTENEAKDLLRRGKAELISVAAPAGGDYSEPDHAAAAVAASDIIETIDSDASPAVASRKKKGA